MAGRLKKRTQPVLSISAAIESLENRMYLSITVNPTASKSAIVSALLAGNTGIKVTSSSLSVQQNKNVLSAGTYKATQGTFGIGSGIIIGNGDVSQYSAPSPPGAKTDTDFGVPATSAQEALLEPISGGQTKHFDVTELDLTFTMPKSLGSVFFNVVFGSREYPEFVGSTFVDAFGLYLNGVNIAQVAGQPVNIDHPDFAASGTNALPGLLEPNGNPTLTFSSFVGPGTKNNTLTFIIADTSDAALDTMAYISALGALPPNPDIPTTSVSASAITTPQASETFTVTYKGKKPISLASIDSNDILVQGPNGFSQAATLVSTDVSSDAVAISATYQVAGPAGSFDSSNFGTYTIIQNFQQVVDTAGNYVTEGTIGDFANNNDTGPAATLSADNTFFPGSQKYFFDVTYTGPFAIKGATVDNGDILVTGPNGFSQTAKRVSVNNDKDNATLTATYMLTAPTGKWSASETGDYAFNLEANQVSDLQGISAPAAALGTVTLLPFGGLTGTPVGEFSNVADSSIANDSTGNPKAVAYYDPIEGVLKYSVLSTKGTLGPAKIVDGTAGQSPVLLLRGNQPCIAYSDATNGSVKFAQLINGKWKITVVDASAGASPRPTLAVNSKGQVTIFYHVQSTGGLKVATLVGSSFTSLTIDSTATAGSFNSVATDPSTGRLAVAYSDSTGGTLKFALEQPGGTYTTSAITGVAGSDGHVSLAFDNKNQAVVTFQHTGTSPTDPSLLEFARLVSGAWTVGTLATDVTNSFTSSQLNFAADGTVKVVYRSAPSAPGNNTVAGTLSIVAGSLDDVSAITTTSIFTQAGDIFSVGKKKDGGLLIITEIANSNGLLELNG